MDLVAGVRKEGSRGGRAEFKWEDVKDSQHRENYLGHSLMAPVGRWQKGRDLSWYSKNNDPGSADAAAEARREEIRKIKEAEQDALSEALGYGPMPKRHKGDNADASNPNLAPLGVGSKDVERVIKEGGFGEEDGDGGKGIGFGSYGGGEAATGEGDRDVLPGDERLDGVDGAKAPQRDRSRDRDRRREKDDRRRHSRDRPRRRHDDREGRRHHRHHHHQHRSRSRDRHDDRSRRYRSRSYDRRRRENPSRKRRRSYSRDRDRKYDRW